MCQVFWPDYQSTSQLLSEVLPKVCRDWANITVLCGYTAIPATNVIKSTEIWNNITIKRFGFKIYNKTNILCRIIGYISYVLNVALFLTFKTRRAKLLTITNPPFMPIISWILRIIRGHEYILMLQDIYPDGLVAVGKLRSQGNINKIWSLLNRKAYHSATEIWVLGRDMAERVIESYNVDRQKVRYIPHWSVVDFEKPICPNETRLWMKLTLENKFIVQYSGNMGLWHDIDTIVRAAELLKDHCEIVFIMIGSGMRLTNAKKLCNDLGLQNMIWLPFQERDVLNDSLSCCHVAIISQRENLEGIAVPCKLYGILASGRAIIAQVPPASEVAITIKEEMCGRVITPGDSSTLAKSILELSISGNEIEHMGANAYSAFRNKYMLSNGVNAFDKGLTRWRIQAL